MPALVSDENLKKATRFLYMSHLAIGDLVYQSVFLEALKKKYPHLEVDVWIDDCRKKPNTWQQGRNKILTEWLSQLPFVNKIYPIADSIEHRTTLISEAHNRQYDIVFFIAGHRTEKYAQIARQISPDGIALGTKYDLFSKPLSKWLAFKKLTGYISGKNYKDACQHISEIYYQLFNKAIGLTQQDVDPTKLLKLNIPDTLKIEAKALVSENCKSNKVTKVFINPISTSTKKDYPWDKLKVVIAELDKRYNLQFFINAPPEKFDELESLIQTEKTLQTINIKTFTAQQSFFQLPALMQECDLLLSVDTATSHLACSLGIPQVTLMRNNSKVWQPQKDALILTGSGRASSIPTQDVITALESYLTVNTQTE